MNYIVSKEQLNTWKDHGYIKISNFISHEDKSNLKLWCDELQNLPETPGKWMKYFETNLKNTKNLCRIENFLDYHEGFNRIANSKKTLDLISDFMGEPAVLFKEKINLKLPNGNGFTPHQDAPAFITFNQTYHITMMLAIDDSTIENGCLQIIKDHKFHGITLPQNKDGSIDNKICDQFKWHALECKTGDILLFDSYLPHFSEKNMSSKSRRSAFITYSRLSEGESKRLAYYKDKREKFPPDCEREKDKDYSQGAAIYNVANPLSRK
jgi:hypothetical protein